MRTLAIALAMLAATTPANAAEINAFISTALKTVTDDVIPPFEHAGGHTVRALYAPPGALLKHFAAGEPADIFLTGREAIDQLIGEGKIVSGRVDLATTGIGICVRQGAPKPDVGDVLDAFKRAMLAAKTVGYAFAPPAAASSVRIFRRFCAGSASPSRWRRNQNLPPADRTAASACWWRAAKPRSACSRSPSFCRTPMSR